MRRGFVVLCRLAEKEVSMYYIYGINSMGSKWYLGDKSERGCTVWTGAPKENRAVYDSEEEARKKVEELDYIYQFGSTRHYIEKV